MSISRRWVERVQNQKAVLTLYRSKELLTQVKIAERLNTTQHNVGHILKNYMPPEEFRALMIPRYSASKTADKNPQWQKTGEQSRSWVGECEDGKGYLTILHNGRREFVHRLVMAKALGLSQLPKRLEVHHIDSDPKNNRLDNLALVTRRGHCAIHSLQAQEPKMFSLRRRSIAAALQYMT